MCFEVSLWALPNQNQLFLRYLNRDKATIMVNQNVMGLKITMQHSLRMNVGNPIKYFFDYDFNLLLVCFVFLAGYILLKVEIVVVKNYFELHLFRLVKHINQRHYVGVLFECFKQCYLSQRTGRNTLFVTVEFDVFYSYILVVLIDCFENFTKSAFSNRANLS